MTLQKSGPHVLKGHDTASGPIGMTRMQGETSPGLTWYGRRLSLGSPAFSNQPEYFDAISLSQPPTPPPPPPKEGSEHHHDC